MEERVISLGSSVERLMGLTCEAEGGAQCGACDGCQSDDGVGGAVRRVEGVGLTIRGEREAISRLCRCLGLLAFCLWREPAQRFTSRQERHRTLEA